ncbi:MAG: TolC family protein [Peptococcaceae bacterium]|nr:TolC family protein [Peptococcaceae bacterium]
MSKIPFKNVALGLALAGSLFWVQPQTAEAALLSGKEPTPEEVAVQEEEQGSPKVEAQLTGEARSISLDEAMELAMTNNATVLKARNDLASAEVAAQKAASQSRTAKQVAQITLPTVTMPTPVYDTDGNVVFVPTTSGGGKAMAKNQTYYAATVYGPEATKKAVEIQTYALASQEAACSLQTIQAYYTVLCDGQAEQSALLALEKAQNQYNVVESRLNQGMATKLELLSAQAQVNGAKAALDAARAKTVQDKRSLNVIMGLDPETNWSPNSQLTYDPLLIKDVEEKVQEIVSGSPMVQLTEVVFELADITKKNDMLAKPSFTYDGKTAELTYQTAKIEYDNAQSVAYTSAKSMLENLSLAREQYEVYNETQALLEEVYRLAVLQYENGLNTQNDIQAAAADLASNDSQRLNALLQYNIAKTAIEQGLVSTGN